MEGRFVHDSDSNGSYLVYTNKGEIERSLSPICFLNNFSFTIATFFYFIQQNRGLGQKLNASKGIETRAKNSIALSKPSFA